MLEQVQNTDDWNAFERRVPVKQRSKVMVTHRAKIVNFFQKSFASDSKFPWIMFSTQTKILHNIFGRKSGGIIQAGGIVTLGRMSKLGSMCVWTLANGCIKRMSKLYCMKPQALTWPSTRAAD